MNKSLVNDNSELEDQLKNSHENKEITASLSQKQNHPHIYNENNKFYEKILEKTHADNNKTIKLTALNFLKFTGFGLQEIIPHLYLSGHDVTNNRKLLLDDKHITHILNLSNNVENSFEKEITYKKVKIEDSPSQDLFACLYESIEFIDSALKDKKSSVLVHCNAGNLISSNSHISKTFVP